MRHADQNWNVGARDDDGRCTWDQIKVSLLMDIRDRLDVLRCSDFRGIPYELSRIRRALEAEPRPSKPQRLAARLAHHRAAVRRARRAACRRRT